MPKSIKNGQNDPKSYYELVMLPHNSTFLDTHTHIYVLHRKMYVGACIETRKRRPPTNYIGRVIVRQICFMEACYNYTVPAINSNQLSWKHFEWREVGVVSRVEGVCLGVSWWCVHQRDLQVLHTKFGTFPKTHPFLHRHSSLGSISHKETRCSDWHTNAL